MTADKNSPVDILQRIAADKLVEVERGRGVLPLSVLRDLADKQLPPRDFVAALGDSCKPSQTAVHQSKQNPQQQSSAKLPVIAEIKRRSPSRGVLRQSFSPAALAKEYEDGGAACLSVLTDRKYFGGGIKHLQMAKAAVSLPVLRKDFILDEWQIFQSRAMGADAILLIAALLNGKKMQQLAKLAMILGMAVLIETHDDEEVQTALTVPGALIGINNRNLRTFVVDINTAIRLIPIIRRIDPNRLIIAESGVKNYDDIDKMQNADAFLIGETLMRAPKPGEALKELFNKK